MPPQGSPRHMHSHSPSALWRESEQLSSFEHTTTRTKTVEGDNIDTHTHNLPTTLPSPPKCSPRRKSHHRIILPTEISLRPPSDDTPIPQSPHRSPRFLSRQSSEQNLLSVPTDSDNTICVRDLQNIISSSRQCSPRENQRKSINYDLKFMKDLSQFSDQQADETFHEEHNLLQFGDIQNISVRSDHSPRGSIYKPKYFDPNRLQVPSRHNSVDEPTEDLLQFDDVQTIPAPPQFSPRSLQQHKLLPQQIDNLLKPPPADDQRDLLHFEELQITKLPIASEYSPRSKHRQKVFRLDSSDLSTSQVSSRQHSFRSSFDQDEDLIDLSKIFWDDNDLPPPLPCPQHSPKPTEKHKHFENISDENLKVLQHEESLIDSSPKLERHLLEVDPETKRHQPSCARSRTPSFEYAPIPEKTWHIEDLEVPPPPAKFSPRPTDRRRDSISRHNKLEKSVSLDPKLSPKLLDRKSYSPTRLEKFLTEAISAQSTLAPIKPPPYYSSIQHETLEAKLSTQSDGKISAAPKTWQSPQCANVHKPLSPRRSLQWQPLSYDESCKQNLSRQSSTEKHTSETISSRIQPDPVESELLENTANSNIVHPNLATRRSWQPATDHSLLESKLSTQSVGAEVTLSPTWLPKHLLQTVTVHCPAQETRSPKTSPKLSPQKSYLETSISPQHLSKFSPDIINVVSKDSKPRRVSWQGCSSNTLSPNYQRELVRVHSCDRPSTDTSLLSTSPPKKAAPNIYKSVSLKSSSKPVHEPIYVNTALLSQKSSCAIHSPLSPKHSLEPDDANKASTSKPPARLSPKPSIELTCVHGITSYQSIGVNVSLSPRSPAVYSPKLSPKSPSMITASSPLPWSQSASVHGGVSSPNLSPSMCPVHVQSPRENKPAVDMRSQSTQCP